MTENFALYARNGYKEVERRTERGFPRIYMRKRLYRPGRLQLSSEARGPIYSARVADGIAVSI